MLAFVDGYAVCADSVNQSHGLWAPGSVSPRLQVQTHPAGRDPLLLRIRPALSQSPAHKSSVKSLIVLVCSHDALSLIVPLKMKTPSACVTLSAINTLSKEMKVLASPSYLSSVTA